MNKLETIGKNIKIHRRALKWTQEQLAKNVGVSASIISKFELGTKPVDVITLIKIASALGVKYSELFRTVANKTMFHNIPVTVQEWDKLQTIANNKGFESDEVAEKIGVTPMAFYNWNTGRNNASLETFQKFLDVIDIQVSDFEEQHELFTEVAEEPKKPDVQKIIVAIDTLIEALEDIRGELCGAE